MINVSQTIKNSCKADKNTHTEYVVINNQIIYIKGYLTATAYKDSTFIGTFNMKVLEFETDNSVQFRNRQFEYYKVIDGNAFKIGTFITTQIVNNDSKDTVKVTANDFALKFAIPYTSQLNYESGQITLLQVLQECCSLANVLLDNQSITNGGFIVDSNQFVNGELVGDVICAIAGISGNFATITSQDKLKLLFYEETDEILEDYTDLDDKRDTQPFTSILIGSSVVQGQEAILKDETLIEQYGEHWVKIVDNPFAYTLEKRQQLITALFEKLKGFGYSSFKSEYTYKPYLTLGDKIKFKNKAGELVDSIILRYDMDFDNCTFEAPSITSSTIDYELSPTAEQTAKRAEIIANQYEASITSIASEVSDQNTKISRIRQDVDEIQSEISDIADITTSGESIYATFNLENINESEPITIRVHPTTENITCLYPYNSLFPSSTTYLKNRVVRFNNTTTNETFDYILPTDLLIYNSEVYDEFYLDYDSNTCQVSKKCGYDANGNVVQLGTEQILTYSYPTIILTEGDYTISLLGYSNGYIFARLMAKNIYTNQFYTKAETNSIINQTSQSIDLSVNSKLSNYSTTDEMNSAISLKANEITSEVSETYETIHDAENTYATKTTANSLSSRITQNTNSITSEVSRATRNENTLSSRISQTAKGISLEVDNGSTSSGITIGITKEDGTTTQTTGTIQMSGLVKFTDLSTSGSTTINGANIQTGTLSARKITTGTLNGSNVNITNLNASNITGGTISANKISGGTINASSINLGSGKFKVNTSGSITSTSGTIGGWDITSSKLRGTTGQSGVYGAIRPYGVQLENSSGTVLLSAGWGDVINATSSDKRLKNTINDIDEKYETLFDDLKPKTFYFNKGLDEGKKHIGFIAQDILQSENKINEDLAMVQEDIMSKKYKLNKQEIIALNTWQIQKLKEEIKLLKKEIENLKGGNK